MAYYENNHFVDESGSPAISMIAPDIYALYAREYGFRYADELQHRQGTAAVSRQYADGKAFIGHGHDLSAAFPQCVPSSAVFGHDTTGALPFQGSFPGAARNITIISKIYGTMY